MTMMITIAIAVGIIKDVSEAAVATVAILDADVPGATQNYRKLIIKVIH